MVKQTSFVSMILSYRQCIVPVNGEHTNSITKLTH